MNQSEFQNRLTTISKDTAKLRSLLDDIGSSNDTQEYRTRNYFAAEAALLSERIAVGLRHLVFPTAQARLGFYFSKCSEIMGIKIIFENEIFKVTIPCQLPKRRQKNTEYLVQPLMAALYEFADHTPLPKFDEAAVCFVYVVSPQKPLSQVQDHDNIENKQILDVIGTFLLQDDNGLLCSTYQRTERGDHDRTEVYVMPRKNFPLWLQEHEKGGIA